MGFTEQEKEKKAEEIKKHLDRILEGKPYSVLVTVLYDSSKKDEKSSSFSFWGMRHIGNVNLLETPFPIINGLINSTGINFKLFIESLMGKGDPDEKK